ncbi:hypothetical protein CALVIDRAFT_345345 [Calocera viscosa TUFC12733]|uniref:Uncharacterized protein n=1 Tax=Calocera viscosa (strain TUFC12733) TaxID=1330018 RepID=A0A167HAN6_CALVF|nr:hypothetical protein CALVIDRAFT_345345 [Calocera viscosa TUFC12733]
MPSARGARAIAWLRARTYRAGAMRESRLRLYRLAKLGIKPFAGGVVGWLVMFPLRRACSTWGSDSHVEG